MFAAGIGQASSRPTLHTNTMTQLKIMPVEECGAIGKCMAHPSSYLSRIQYGEKTTARAAALALQDLEAARARDIATHERNLPALENNALVALQIRSMNEAVGMPARWSERDRNSRSRYPKTIGHDAGYITDIRRECKTDDGFDAATVQYERTLKSYREYEEQGKREAEAAARAKEREQAAALEKRKADIELAAILLRYCLPIESTWSDVLQALRGRHQRLDLAVAMAQTRSDWSEGPYRVRGAMDRFTIRDNEDKDIANDVLGCMDDFSDGRVFRDTRWSYDALFASVENRQLVADVQRAMQLASDD
jgi:hypothetical protein